MVHTLFYWIWYVNCPDVKTCVFIFRTTLDMTKEFCYKCGHKNMKKVSMSINEDGSIQYHLSRRKPVSTRGMRVIFILCISIKLLLCYLTLCIWFVCCMLFVWIFQFSLPTPKGGKHAHNPVLCADQKEAQQRMARQSKVKYDAFDPDFVAHSSPFAPTDVHSKSAQLGIRDYKHAFRNKRNPNENKKVYGRRKWCAVRYWIFHEIVCHSCQ